MSNTIELDSLKSWIGRTERHADDVTAAPIAGLAATLDRAGIDPLPGSDLPPLWHWLYFLPRAPQSQLGEDGHPKRGGFLPPVPLPRRMWAGGRLTFEHPLHVGDEITRDSEIADVAVKQGKNGALVFVTVRHRVTNAGGLAIVEEHDIVYRDVPKADAPKVEPAKAPTDESFSRLITPDPVLLFRYSALTFNGHRIHYDRSYVTEVEGYPGLIVHGPLIATLLMDLLQRQHPDAQVRSFSFKALSPLFDIASFTVCGRPDGGNRFALWARGPAGELCMQATAELA